MAAFLLLEPLAQGFHQLFEPAKRLDLGLFLGTQVLFGHFLKPVGGNIDGFENLLEADVFQPLEACRESLVELVKVAFVLHHCHAGKIIERLDIIGREAFFHGFQKAQEFTQGNRDAGFAEILEEREKHETGP